MEEELENGIALMEGILQNWENGNKGKYHIFFPRCAKENDKDVILFPIFEETKNKTLNLKIWAKYNLENYSLEDYLEVKNKVILFDKKLINYKKKKFAKNVISLLEIFYTAQEFMDLSEDSIEYIANQELLEEKIYEYKQNFKIILQEEELAIAYGVKKNETIKTEKAKLPVTNNVVDIQNIEQNVAKIQTEEPVVVDIHKEEPKKKVDLTIKRLQEGILKIDNKNSSKEKYMLNLIEEVGELAKVINADARMKDKEITGTIEEELQDVLYYVTCLANFYGIDLEECVYLKEELNCKKYDRENIFKDEQ
jgi:NTP pyrophosphatase (non-canonical NTP hydrolase)